MKIIIFSKPKTNWEENGEFGIKIPLWEEQGFIEKEIKSGTHGGYQNQYYFTPKARKEIVGFIFKILEILNVNEDLINSLKQLDKDGRKRVITYIRKFFKDSNKK